ncbi:MAG: beta-propeller repeat protein, partial [Verrucomicrobiales bacterium]|nr:beta-propeller repeat protein [Verrucomicrobiales bacterium]
MGSSRGYAIVIIIRSGHYAPMFSSDYSCLRLLNFFWLFLFLSRVSASTLIYSSYLGAEGNDSAVAVTRGPDGAIYILGNTRSSTWLTNSTSVLSVNANPEQGVFIVKLDGTTHGLIYRTAISGNVEETALGLTVDSNNRPLIAGTTTSSTLPGIGSIAEAGSNIFLLRLAADGKTIELGRIFGGAGDDTLTAFNTEASGNVIIAGKTDSLDFAPTSGTGSLFIARISSATGAILISDRFGGSSDDLITSICASSNNDIIFGGYTDSEDFPA